jgi:hypothetical protein
MGHGRVVATVRRARAQQPVTLQRRPRERTELRVSRRVGATVGFKFRSRDQLQISPPGIIAASAFELTATL